VTKEFNKYPDRPNQESRNKSFIDPSYALSEGSWALLARHGVGTIVGLAGTIILPLALGVRDWGYFATAFFFSTAVEMILANNGISAFIIQSSVSPADEATANALQFILGLLMFLFSCLASFFCSIASDGGYSPLVYLLPMVGLSALLSSFSTVPLALMAKKFHFGRVAVIELTGLVSLYAVSIPLALCKTPVEVLAIGFVVRAAMWAALGYLYERPRKLLTVHNTSLKKILRIGGPVCLSNAGAWFVEAVIPLVAGMLLGTAALGVYRITYAILNFPRVISYIFGRVLFSILSAENNLQIKSNLSWKVFLGLTNLLSPVILTIGALSPLWAQLIFVKREWTDLPIVLLPAGIHWTFYTMCYIPIQALIAARKSYIVVRYFTLYSIFFLFATLGGAAFLGIITVPIAGIAASVASLLLLKEFPKTYYGGGFGALIEQLILLLPASIITWYLARSGKSVACLVLWVLAIAFWLAYSKDGRHWIKAFVLDFVLIVKTKPEKVDQKR
jgi:O-antigen/teichoic acid export membrane protein